MPDDFKIKDLARRVKEKYPEYAEVDDTELATRVATKYPEYGEYIGVDDTSRKRQAIEKGASLLGIDPVDYATAMSYESAGTFDPWVKGPVTKWGQHRGTIQYGEPQQKKFGVHKGQTFEDQVTTSNVKYLKAHGVKPGMSFAQIYSAINGGSVNKDPNTPDWNTGRTIADNIRKADKEHRSTVLKKFWGNEPPSLAPQTNPLVEQGIIEPTVYTPAPEQILTPIDESAWSGVQQTPQVGAPQLEAPQAMPEQTQAEASPTNEQYAEWLKLLEIPDSNEARTEFNRLMQGTVDTANAENKVAYEADKKAVDEYNANLPKQDIPQQKVAQNAVKQQETPPNEQFRDTEVRFRYDKSKGDLVEQDKNATTSKLAEATGVDYATVRQFLENHNWYDVNESPSEREAQAKADVTQVRKIPASVQNDIVQFATRKKANETTFNAAKEKVLAENTGLDTNPEILDILAAKEAGFIGKYEAERKIAKTRDEYIDWLVTKGYAREDAVEKAFGVHKADDKPISAFDWALKKNPLANLLTGTRTEDAEKVIRKSILDDINQYGSLANATKVYKEQEKEREFNQKAGVGNSSQALKTAARYIAKIPSTIGDTVAMAVDYDPVSIGYEYVTGNETGVRKALLGVSEQWRNAVDSDLALMQNPAYKNDFIANELAEGLSQFAVQMIAAPLTGGASLALPLMEGATAQYREADKAGADRATRITAGSVGALLAVPDVLLKAKYLKGLSGSGKLQFIENLTGGLFTKLAKSFSEKEAKQITKDTIGAFIKKALTNTSLGFAGEYTQEQLEDVGNKALAKATYKPELTWKEVILPTSQERRGYLAAGIAGLVGGTVETAVEKMSDRELKRGETELGKLLEAQRISQGDYDKAIVALKREIASRIKRGVYFAKDAKIQAEVAGAEAIENFIQEPTAEPKAEKPKVKVEEKPVEKVVEKLDPKLTTIDKDEGVAGTGFRRRVVEDPVKEQTQPVEIPVEKPDVSIKEQNIDIKQPSVDDVNIKTPVAKKLDAVKQLQQEKRQALAEIETEAKSLEAQGQVQEAKKLRDDITAEYNAKILEAKKKPTVEPKVAPLTPTKPKVAPQPVETPKKILSTQADGSDLKVGDKVKRVVEYGGEKIIRHGTVEQTKSGLRVIERDTEASHPLQGWSKGNAPLASAVNASGESAASLEAQSRLKGEQARGEYRVVVDTRSGAETKLFGVNAVDHFKLQPYQQTEWRGGKRDGEIIDRGSATRAYIRKTAPLAMVAWHGSPHKFDKFDSSKIGTGEGAQAYGHGLYFTDKEGVADYYKNTLSQTKRFTPEYDAIVKEVTEQFDPEWNKAIENFKRLDLKYGTSEYRTAEAKVNDVHERRRKEIERRVALKTGSKYKVDLKPEADEYLLWDKPLSEQSEKVREALKSADEIKYGQFTGAKDGLAGKLNGVTGANIYEYIARRPQMKGQAGASNYLKSLGIRGIKYLDGSSRNKGEGSYNYVIFDDTDVEIQEVLAKVPTKATPEMEAAVTYDTGRLATKAKFEVDGSTISLDNLDAYGIAHQAMQIFDPNYTHFFGVTLDGAQIKEVRTAMRKFAKDAIFTKAEKEGFNRFIKAIDTAAKANPKPTVKFILMPEAIAHESAHEARIQTMATASVEGSQSKDWIKGVVSSPLFKRSTIADRYGRVSDAVQALEFIDQLIAKSYDELGLDPDTNANEIVDAIQAWADDFIKTNGEVDWKYYEKLNEVNSHLISLISETKGGDTKNTVKQEAERSEAKADSKAVGAKPQKLKSRTPGKSGVEFDETEAQEAKKQGQKVAALSKQLGYELYYDPQSEDATDIKASQLLEKIGVQSAIEQALYGKPNPASSRVLDWELERLSAVAEAHKELGNDAEYAATMDYYSDLLAGAAMRRIQTGREVQSYRRLGSLTPVSAQLVAQKLKKLAFGDDAKLTPEQTKQVEDLAKELQAAVKQIEKSNIIIAEQQRIIDNADETDTKTPLNRQEALLNNYKKKEKIILAELEKRFPTSPLFKGNAPLAMAMESDVVLDAKTEGLLKDYTIGQILTNRSYENVISEIREISGVSLEQAKDIHAIAADEIRGASEPVSAEAKKRIQIRKEHYAEADKHAHPEKAAKKAIGLAETSLKRQIETLEKEIATGEKAVKQKGKVTSPEIERLKRDRDALKTERDTLLGTGLTEQQKVDRAIKAVRKSINNTTEKIKANDLAVIRKQPVNSDELTALRAEQKTLRSILNDMRREAKKTQTQVSGLSKIAQQAVEFYPEDYELIAVINYLTQQKPKSINEALNYLQKTFGFQITEAKEIAIKAQQAIDRIKASNKVAAEKAKGIKDSEQAKLDAATRKATQESLKLNRFLKNFGQNPNAIKRFNNDFRAKLISNYGTQLFNFIQSFTVSTPATAMLDMIEAGYRALGVNIGEATDVQALDAFRTYLFLSGTNRQLAIDALSMFPEQYYTVHAGLMGDIELELQPLAGEKTNPIAKGVHWWFDKNDKLNRWLAHKTGAKYQEMLFRNAVVASTFDNIIRKRTGGSLESAMKDGTFKDIITENDATRAAQRALEVTFASQIDDPFGKWLKRGYDKLDNYVPVLFNPVTYARFTYTATKVMVLNPLTFGGYDQAIHKLADKKNKTQNRPEYNTREIAKGTLAWSGVAVAYGLMSWLGGDDDKWYTIYPLGKDGPIWDVRRTFPLSSFFYMAHLIKSAPIIGDDSPPPTIKEFLGGFASLELEYFQYGPAADLVGEVGTAYSTQSVAKVPEASAALVASYFAGLLRFFKPAKDILAQAWDKEAAVREYDDSMSDKVIEQLSKSIPAVNALYDAPVKKDIQGNEVLMPFPLGRAFGINLVHPSFVSPKDSSATQWANKVWKWTGTGEMTLEERKAYNARKAIQNAWRTGNKIKVEQALKNMETTLTPKSKSRLQDELKYSELGAKVKYNFGDNPRDIQALKTVWARATSAEKQEITKILKDKDGISQATRNLFK